MNITQFVSVKDVQSALHCSLSTAYTHLRKASGRTEGHGLLRVRLDTWERYINEVLCGSSNGQTLPTGNVNTETSRGNSLSALPNAPIRKQQRRGRLNGSAAPVIPIPRVFLRQPSEKQ